MRVDHCVAGRAAGDADDRRRQTSAALEVLERGKNLLECEVPADAEDHQRIGVFLGERHAPEYRQPGKGAWPDRHGLGDLRVRGAGKAERTPAVSIRA